MKRACVVIVMLLVCAHGRAAFAAEPEDGSQRFASAARALAEGRVSDAITEFEELADRGVVDAAVSFDRGLSYAARVKIGAEKPGDLGSAAHGFEEARELSPDSKLSAQATQALGVLRAEVARRRAHSGDPVNVDQTSFFRSVVHAIPENAWSVAALVASLMLGAALFVRFFASHARAKVGATIGWAVTSPVLVFCALMAFFARGDRLHLQQGVMVTDATRPADERGAPLANAVALPEAALVDIVGSRPGWTRVQWGDVDGWVPSTAVRAVAKP